MDIQAIIAVVTKYVPVALQVIGGFSALAAITANKVDDKIINGLLKVINLLGMNVGT